MVTAVMKKQEQASIAELFERALRYLFMTVRFVIHLPLFFVYYISTIFYILGFGICASVQVLSAYAEGDIKWQTR